MLFFFNFAITNQSELNKIAIFHAGIGIVFVIRMKQTYLYGLTILFPTLTAARPAFAEPCEQLVPAEPGLLWPGLGPGPNPGCRVNTLIV